jgi:hypothetical protein
MTRTYLLWSGDRQAWWRPDAGGYTTDISEAGWYSEADAKRYEKASEPRGDFRTRAVPVSLLAVGWLLGNVPEVAQPREVDHA